MYLLSMLSLFRHEFRLYYGQLFQGHCTTLRVSFSSIDYRSPVKRVDLNIDAPVTAELCADLARRT